MFHKAELLGKRVSCAVLLLCGVLCIAGCGGNKGTVTGSASLNGEPLTSGRVAFFQDGQAPAIANISEDGSFQLAIGSSKGIEPGEYKVTVSSYDVGKASSPQNPPPVKLITPKNYSDVTTTPLTSTVVKGSNQIDLELVTN
ncbi:hypothetical protein NG895_30070 [Aeoliella sp. ICT_H6.2]|uniref:Carboxypeptidase regulatory-like domain-containing protein n=1 Tax=Aeoliella straminimaris TaxID=2954799 RepID=A0A9X2JKE0_9BACT|nr:hypothetical protein [Aeoliella straminimaris]MCO6048163.1 hypothetical protein [Aeoliella straminimaris]